MRITYLIHLLMCLLIVSAVHSDELNNHLDPLYKMLSSEISNNPKDVINQLENIDISNKSPVQLAQHYYIFSQVYLNLIYPDKSIKYTTKALSYLHSPEDEWLIQRINLTKSQALDVLNQAKDGLPLALQAVSWAKQNKDQEFYVESLLGLGYIYNTLGKYIDALDTFMRAYNLAPEEGSELTKGAIAGSVALVYEYRHEHALCIPYFEESVEYQRKSGNQLELSISLYGLGKAYKNTGNKALGAELLQEALDISREIEDKQGIAYALMELAPLEILKGHYKKAEAMLIEASQIFEEGNVVSMTWDTYDTLAELYVTMKDLPKAEAAFAKSRKFLNAETMPVQTISSLEREAMLMAARGEHEPAYQLLESTYKKKQKLRSQQSMERLLDLRTRYELESKEKENLILEQENEKNKFKLFKEDKENQILWLGLITATVIVFLLLLLIYKSRHQKKILEYLAHTDSLTSLPNRLFIIDTLECEMQNLSVNEKLFICMVDLDHFKKINDNFGHETGDKVLIAFSDLCNKYIVSPDLVGRLGGEEFLIILKNCTQQQAYEKVLTLNASMYEIAKQLNLEKNIISFSAGLGYCMRQHNLDEQLKKADDALYVAKNQGRNRIIIAE